MAKKLYRILSNLDGPKGSIIYSGSLNTLGWVSKQGIEILTKMSAIAEVAPPPLSALDGWKQRALRLEKLGIITAVDLLTTSASELAAKLRTRVDVIEKWQQEVREWLTVSPKG